MKRRVFTQPGSKAEVNTAPVYFRFGPILLKKAAVATQIDQ